MLSLFLLADVFANLFVYMADVIAIDVSYCGRCYCHHSLLAGVNAILIVAMIVWQMLLPLWIH